MKTRKRIVAEMRIMESILRDDFKTAISIAEDNGISEKEFAKLAKQAQKTHKKL